MQPRTIIQKQATRLSRLLPAISDAQKNWAFKYCFEHIGRRNSKGMITCLECGHSWRDGSPLTDLSEVICPLCSTKLTIQQTLKRVFEQVDYVCFTTICKGFQVLRFCYVKSVCRYGKAAEYDCSEVVQRWISDSGKQAVLARLRPMFCFSDSWYFTTPLEIRPDKPLYNINPSLCYPRGGILPILKRNGFNGDYHGLSPFDLCRALLTEPKAETLLKTGQYSLLRHFIYRNFRDIDTFWPSIRICMRNHYEVKDASLWCDMIRQIGSFGKDILSPKYVCPDDLHREHDRWEEKRRKQEQREQRERQQQEAERSEQQYREQKGRFFGLCFSDGEITVHVLESVREFVDESRIMHHCVFSSRYFERTDSLILSACMGNHRLETIEVSLDTGMVVQSRGVSNKNTPYHDRIVELVNQNIRQIEQRKGA